MHEDNHGRECSSLRGELGITFLFTDIEGSTRLAREQVQFRHPSIVRWQCFAKVSVTTLIGWKQVVASLA
jgi:hypothetical protein